MSCIIIRCDASNSIGSGHVTRCRTLARELKKRGSKVIFICRRQKGNLINLIEEEFQTIAIPERPLINCEGLDGRTLYSAWLGCDQATDAKDCIKSLSKAGIKGADWIVVDHYGIDIEWETLMITLMSRNNNRPKLLVIDDLADRKHQADLLLDQNYYGRYTEQRYKELVPKTCKTLTGPHYALLGAEYAHLHSIVPKRNEIKRILIFFGGVDEDNLTARTLKALMHGELKDIAADVVLGYQSLHREEIKNLISQRNNTYLHEPLSSLAGLIARADLAIGAGGTTTWERNCLGLPSLVVTISSNQEQLVKALNRIGNIEYLGNGKTVTEEQIRLAITARVRKQMKTPNKMTDGWGASRVALGMLGKQGTISLRPVAKEDEGLLLNWANEYQVRSNSFSPKKINTNEHRKWFKIVLDNHNKLLFIAMEASGCPIGQIRFDLRSESNQEGINEVDIDLSIDKCARGQGQAERIVWLGIHEMTKRWGTKIQVIADVLESNVASNKCFARVGFTKDESSLSKILLRSGPVSYWRWRKDVSHRF